MEKSIFLFNYWLIISITVETKDLGKMFEKHLSKYQNRFGEDQRKDQFLHAKTSFTQ